jgi:serine kinase of HPr protein (carbohydrate metabolism regulator)
LALTIWEQAKLLIADDRVQIAKEIAEWIGIAGGAGLGLFTFIKKIRGQK